jgi:hypothetical protein
MGRSGKPQRAFLISPVGIIFLPSFQTVVGRAAMELPPFFLRPSGINAHDPPETSVVHFISSSRSELSKHNF